VDALKRNVAVVVFAHSAGIANIKGHTGRAVTQRCTYDHIAEFGIVRGIDRMQSDCAPSLPLPPPSLSLSFSLSLSRPISEFMLMSSEDSLKARVRENDRMQLGYFHSAIDKIVSTDCLQRKIAKRCAKVLHCICFFFKILI